MKLKTIRVAIEEVSINKKKVCFPKDAIKCFKELGESDREQLWALHLNHNLCLISKELISSGGLTRGNTNIREIFKGAMLQNASGIVLGHVHPGSQGIEFSEGDIRLAKQVIKASYILSIILCDFMMVNLKGQYTSLRLTKPKLFEGGKR